VRAAYAGRTQKLYVNWGFGADNKVRSPQQLHRGSTGKQPAIGNYIYFCPLAVILRKTTDNHNNNLKKLYNEKNLDSFYILFYFVFMYLWTEYRQFEIIG
jgi:hypothetical protein